MKRIGRRDVAVKKYRRPETFKLCLCEFMQEDPDGVIDVYRLSENGLGLPICVGVLDFEEACECEMCTEELLRDYFGGGRYRLRFTDPGGRILASYGFNLYGPAGGSKWRPKGELSDDERIGRILADRIAENIKLQQAFGLALLMKEMNKRR